MGISSSGEKKPPEARWCKEDTRTESGRGCYLRSDTKTHLGAVFGSLCSDLPTGQESVRPELSLHWCAAGGGTEMPDL